MTSTVGNQPSTDDPKKIYRKLITDLGLADKLPQEPEEEEEEDSDDDISDIPELQQSPPEPLKPPFTEEQIKRNAERKYRRLERKAYQIFYPPGQSLYANNEFFREKMDECNQIYMDYERTQGRVPVSAIDAIFPFRDLPAEKVNDFLETLKREVNKEARDPEAYATEKGFPKSEAEFQQWAKRLQEERKQ